MKRHSIPRVVVGLIPAAFLLAGCSPPAAAAAPQPGQLPAAKAEKGEQKTLDEAVKRLKDSKAEERVAGATALGKLEFGPQSRCSPVASTPICGANKWKPSSSSSFHLS